MSDLSMRLAGRQIEAIMKTQNTLVIRCEDGTECHVAWMNEAGDPTEGEPAVVWFGRNVLAKTAKLFPRSHGLQ
jgi:hypothetical protein